MAFEPILNCSDRSGFCLGALVARRYPLMLGGNRSCTGMSDGNTAQGGADAAKIADLAAKGHKVSAHLRGSKADIWDGGHRVPFIVRWPGKIKSGSTSDQLICHTDLFATLAESKAPHWIL